MLAPIVLRPPLLYDIALKLGCLVGRILMRVRLYITCALLDTLEEDFTGRILTTMFCVQVDGNGTLSYAPWLHAVPLVADAALQDSLAQLWENDPETQQPPNFMYLTAPPAIMIQVKRFTVQQSGSKVNTVFRGEQVCIWLHSLVSEMLVSSYQGATF